MATGQLDNPMRIKQVRHEIARILTTLRQRHVEADVEQEVAKSEAAALGRSRAAQASGELKGTPLGEAITEVPSDAEPMAMAWAPVPSSSRTARASAGPVAASPPGPQGRGRPRPRPQEAQAEAAAAEAEAAQAEGRRTGGATAR